MAEFMSIAISDIIVPDRLRVVEEDHALAIQTSIVEHGLINPITVRRTPPATKGFKPYTLVAGAHRLRAFVLLDEPSIEAIVVEADKLEGQLLEITENLFRNELSALDRAMFVMTYREVWEQKNGKISRGGDQSAKIALRSDPTTILENEAHSGFSAHVAERLGVSKRTVVYAQTIAKALSPELRQRLRGTPVADNQSQLLKLASMEPARQKLVAKAYGATPDIKRAIELTDPNAKAKATVSQQQELLSRLVSTWDRSDEKTRAAFLEHAKATLKKTRQRLPSLTELLAQTEPAGPDPNQITIFDALGEERGA